MLLALQCSLQLRSDLEEQLTCNARYNRDVPRAAEAHCKQSNVQLLWCARTDLQQVTGGVLGGRNVFH